MPRFALATLSALVLSSLAGLTGCATNAVTGRSQYVLVSEQSAIAQSSQAYTALIGELDKQGKLNDDAALQARIDEITGRLVAQAVRYRPETRDWDWSVKVIDEPDTLNAFCMAGGKMAIYTGLIEKLEATDDELAQVMGHEIGHAIANHSAEKMSVAMTAQLGVAVVAALGKNARDQAARAQAGTLAAATLVMLPNSRAAETEADHIGIELAARAGYHPDAAVTLWEKMAKAGGKTPPTFLSTHPAPQDRMADLRNRGPLMMPFYLGDGPRARYDLAAHRLTAADDAEAGGADALADAGGPLMLHSDAFDRFSRGEAELPCEGPCAWGFAFRRGELKRLHDQGHWRLLVHKVMDAGYRLDLTWFYLGRAAQHLGYVEPARLYYRRAAAAAGRPATHCKGALQDWCDGLEFPRAAEDAAAALAAH